MKYEPYVRFHRYPREPIMLPSHLEGKQLLCCTRYGEFYIGKVISRERDDGLSELVVEDTYRHVRDVGMYTDLPEVFKKQCPTCTTHFITNLSRKLYCCQHCSSLASGRRQRARRKEREAAHGI